MTRFVSQDDIHNGRLIEKGTVVLVNFWSVHLTACLSHIFDVAYHRGMLRNEEFYPEPHAFKPERWLGQGDRRQETHPLNAAFGFGRRCAIILRLWRHWSY